MLYAAACLLVAIAAAHSWLGERRLLMPLFTEGNNRLLSIAVVTRLLRWVWHWMSIAMVLFAGLLLLMRGQVLEVLMLKVQSGLWAFSAAMCLYCAGPKHPGFIGFTIVTLLLIAYQVL